MNVFGLGSIGLYLLQLMNAVNQGLQLFPTRHLSETFKSIFVRMPSPLWIGRSSLSLLLLNLYSNQQHL
jgi:hypothetical protein